MVEHRNAFERCWCESAEFSAALLLRARHAGGDPACICPSCARAPAQSPQPTGTEDKR
jgi:Cysteine-rich CWC